MGRFDPSALAAKSGEIRTINDKVLGEISYGVITFGERLEIDRITDEGEKMRAMVWTMLRKGNPTFTQEEMNKLEDDSVTYLFGILREATDFRARKRETKQSKMRTSEPSCSTSRPSTDQDSDNTPLGDCWTKVTP